MADHVETPGGYKAKVEKAAHSVLALLSDPTARQVVRLALLADLGPRSGKTIHFCTGLDELLALAESWPPELFVIDLDSRLSGTAAHLRRRFPRTALVGWLDTAPGSHVVRTAMHGDFSDVVLPEEGRNPEAVAIVMQRARASSVVAQSQRVFRNISPPHLQDFLGRLLVLAHRPITAERAAELYGRDRETLRRHLRQAALPPVNKLIVWCRLLHAADLLESPQRTIEQVAHALDFPSRKALANQFGRYVGKPPKIIRAEAGLRFVLGELGRRHENDDWSLKEP